MKSRHIALASAIIMMMMTSMTAAASSTSLYSGDTSKIVYDGVVKDGEYPYQLSLTALDGSALATVYFLHDGTNMYVGIVSATDGWIGFGMNTKGNGMIGGDFILTENDKGWVVYDAYSEEHAQPIPDSESRLLEASASVVGDKTNTEFKFALASSDTQDLSIAVGDTISFFVAGGLAGVDAVAYHDQHRVDPINLKVEETSVTAPGATLSLATEKSSSFLPVFFSVVAVLALIPIIRRRR